MSGLRDREHPGFGRDPSDERPDWRSVAPSPRVGGAGSRGEGPVVSTIGRATMSRHDGNGWGRASAIRLRERSLGEAHR